ncbi:Carboxymuconolactone decarboxylase [Dethiosulfovibrio peptidovorans DSM 11002]|uniref:Carboxymuconolactone decarboxylase n=1 Tax=Dethiosulfovibrio peptidovorans DSM 11002 TaxID=469381 RepID=D2Z6I1_9BACT|nr:flavodoxin [Dethiosulfovibrio peptidovorans]EFC91078.1 Carboxymuconolactone decarboxylase [Dethiosulfovibrio peptidovorans DSM 11002]
MGKVTAGKEMLGDFAPQFAGFNDDVLFGEVWSREDKLAPRERSIVTVSALLSSGILDSSLKFHIQKAKDNGVTKEEMVKDMGRYDVVLIGFPIWWYVAPRIIQTFLESYDFSGKKISLFATSGMSGMGDTQEILRLSCPGAATWGAGRRFSESASESEINRWVGKSSF